LLKRWQQLEKARILEAYFGALLLESDKEKFLPWLADNAEKYEAYRKWRFYNPMLITEPVVRVN
jgi:hypothetical protein